MAGGKGLLKKLELSDELADFMGKAKASRAEITKALWAYIKKKKLQDPSDKRSVIPDDTLEPILGSRPLTMFQIPKKVSEHIIPE